MTKTQMQKRFKELGGKTEANAIKITIEKYVEMMTPKMMKLLFRQDSISRHYPTGYNCGCCEYFVMNESVCPIGNRAECAGSYCCTEYIYLGNAIVDKNENTYLAACRRILDKLKGQ